MKLSRNFIWTCLLISVSAIVLLLAQVIVHAAENHQKFVYDLKHPEFIEEEAMLFAAGPDHPAIYVRTGDIALRLGDDVQVAVGTYPIPVSFSDNLKSADGANWNYYREVYQRLYAPGTRTNLSMSWFLEFSYERNVLHEAGLYRSSQQDIPKELKLSPQWLKKMRGKYKKFVFDDFHPRSPEAEAHRKLDGFERNYYKLDGLNEDKVTQLVHYYPGTPFVSHAGIIAVERVNGKPKIFIYDAVPGQNGDPQEDDRFPSGLRKLTPAEFYGTVEAQYGMVFRVNLGTRAQQVQALEKAWERYYSANSVSEIQDKFDYEFDWRQSAKVSCSSFVWRSYIEGAHLNIITGLNFTLVPSWVIRMKTGYTVRMDLQVAPQSLLNSLYTQRLIDFQSSVFEPLLESVSNDGAPLPLPSQHTRDSTTGHLTYSTDFLEVPEGF